MRHSDRFSARKKNLAVQHKQQWYGETMISSDFFLAVLAKVFDGA